MSHRSKEIGDNTGELSIFVKFTQWKHLSKDYVLM